MPIYEFYCPHCHRVYNFLSRAVNTSGAPACPRCGRPELVRRASLFAISKGRKEEPAADAGGEPPLDEARLERAMESLAQDFEGVDENNPRQGAHLMRKVFEAAGLPIGAGMQEALRRMESGEDPDKIEEELGDALEEDPFAGMGGEAGGEGPRKGLAGLRRRVLPPSVDPELHEM
jgi:putative FmdB family regulatory protein